MNDAAHMNGLKLNEEGAELFDKLIQNFKARITSVADEVIGSLYVDIAGYIEHDVFFNLRNDIVSAFSRYNDGGAYKPHLKKLREHILANHREELIEDLNQDNLDKIAELEQTIKSLQELRRMI